MKNTILAVICFLFACTGPTGPQGAPGTPTGGDLEPNAYECGSLAIKTSEFAYLAPNDGQNYDFKIHGDPVYLFARGAQIAKNDTIAPLIGYIDALKLGSSYPQNFWLVCANLINYAYITIDSAVVDTYYISYTLNCTPNSTRF